MKQESLDRANAFLSAAAARAQPDGFLDTTPAELGREIGVDDPLAAARAMRALLAWRRLEAVDGRYRLLDARPVEPGEREVVTRAPRAKKTSAKPRAKRADNASDKMTYADVGRQAVDRLIDLGREVATLRAGIRTAREEARASREALDEAERRARTLGERVKELEARAEMAEGNLRTLLAAARGAGRDVPVGNTEMEAILGVLKGGPEEGETPAPS